VEETVRGVGAGCAAGAGGAAGSVTASGAAGGCCANADIGSAAMMRTIKNLRM
jgi:hypothetical protein